MIMSDKMEEFYSTNMAQCLKDLDSRTWIKRKPGDQASAPHHLGKWFVRHLFFPLLHLLLLHLSLVQLVPVIKSFSIDEVLVVRVFPFVFVWCFWFEAFGVGVEGTTETLWKRWMTMGVNKTIQEQTPSSVFVSFSTWEQFTLSPPCLPRVLWLSTSRMK